MLISFVWKVVIFTVVLDFAGFTSTINTEFETILLNALFSLIESLIDAQ